METLLISGKDFDTLEQLCAWANYLVGRTVPHHSGLKVTKIVQFQVVPEQNKFGAMLLVEVEKKSSMSSMVLNMRKDLGLSKKEEE